ARLVSRPSFTLGVRTLLEDSVVLPASTALRNLSFSGGLLVSHNYQYRLHTKWDDGKHDHNMLCNLDRHFYKSDLSCRLRILERCGSGWRRLLRLCGIVPASVERFGFELMHNNLQCAVDFQQFVGYNW